MWCAKCQSEVAVEVRPNSQRLQCATCGSEILPKMSGRSSPVTPGNTIPGNPSSGTPSSASFHHGSQPSGERPAASANHVPGAIPPAPGKSPHDLLARWAGNQMFDPYGPLVPPEPKKESSRTPRVVPPTATPPAPAAATPVVRPLAETPPPAPSDQSARIRVDPAFTQGWSEIPAPHASAPLPRASAGRTKLTEQDMPAGYRAHEPARLKGPHFDPARIRPPVYKSSWVAIFGQSLAYLGAATLTGGAALVLVGYLGGPTHYAPTGWFTTTVGQMLLFLGVVTLVSAGMEQTTVEVTQRIDTLSEQIDRMEYRTQSHTDSDADVEAELRAEIAHLRHQLSEQSRG